MFVLGAQLLSFRLPLFADNTEPYRAFSHFFTTKSNTISSHYLSTIEMNTLSVSPAHSLILWEEIHKLNGRLASVNVLYSTAMQTRLAQYSLEKRDPHKGWKKCHKK